MITQDQLDKLANEYNKTKDPKLKTLWYKKVKEFADGSDYFKRRIVSTNSRHQRDDGTYSVIRKPRLL
jgi:hypothetical protein